MRRFYITARDNYFFTIAINEIILDKKQEAFFVGVKIRMTRMGTKKRPFYRIVAVDSRKKRDGVYLEKLGTYHPLDEDAEKNVVINVIIQQKNVSVEKMRFIAHWI